MKAGKSSYVFPGLNQCFGLILPAQTPDEDIDMFEGLLTQFSQFQVQEIIEDDEKQEADNEQEAGAEVAAESMQVAEKEAQGKGEDKAAKYGKKAAKWIRKGTDLAQIGIKKGTVLAGKGIRKSKDYIKTQITSREEMSVSEETKSRIKKAKQASAVVVTVSKAITIGAKAVCTELASGLAEAASKTEIGQKNTK